MGREDHVCQRHLAVLDMLRDLETEARLFAEAERHRPEGEPSHERHLRVTGRRRDLAEAARRYAKALDELVLA